MTHTNPVLAIIEVFENPKRVEMEKHAGPRQTASEVDALDANILTLIKFRIYLVVTVTAV
jgi:chorismate mutase